MHRRVPEKTKVFPIGYHTFFFLPENHIESERLLVVVARFDNRERLPGIARFRSLEKSSQAGRTNAGVGKA